MSSFFTEMPVAGYIAIGVTAFVFGILLTLLCVRLVELKEDTKHD